MRKLILLIVVFTIVASSLVAFLFFNQNQQDGKLIIPKVTFNYKPKPLDKYNFDELSKRVFLGSEITLEEVISEEETYTSWFFSYLSEGKKVTGMANIPKGEEKMPVILMMRGYVDDEIYFTGLGTRKAAGVFAENGFITLAPDFLGFGGSDTCSADILEARFEKPLTVLNLLASVKNLPQADSDKIFFWAHSNGGQIALSVLEITKEPIPTSLWAPVTTGFPESVLQYIGELDDQGLKVKNAIDNFLSDYDPQKYSIDAYFADIMADMQLHQGLSDPLVSEEASDNFAKTMANLSKNINYYKYPGNDHNLSRDWDTAIQRDLSFFKRHL